MKRLIKPFFILVILLLTLVSGAWAANYYVDSSSNVPGSVTSGKFQTGEQLLQDTSNARAWLVNVSASGPLVITGIVGTPTSTNGNTWTGQTSGAVFTQTGKPSPNGNNSNDGSQGSPWASLSGVSGKTLNSGDIVSFRRGCRFGDGNLDYLTLNPAWSNITFNAYGSGAKPLFCGMRVVSDHTATGWTYNGGGVYYYTPGAFSVCNWVMEDENVLDKASNYNCSDGHWFFDTTNAGGHGNNTLYYKPPTNDTPANHRIYRISNPAIISIPTGTFTNFTLQNIAFRGGYGTFYNATGTTINGFTVDSCDFDNCASALVFIAKVNNFNNITVTNNTFNYCAINVWLESNNTSCTNTSCLVSNNTFKNCQICPNGAAFNANNDYDVIGLQNIIDTTISHNYISGTANTKNGISYWRNDNVNGIGNIFSYNYITGVGGIPISIDTYWASDTGVTSAQIYCNIVTDYGTASGGPWGGIRCNHVQSSDSPSCVYNNVCYNGDIGIYLYSHPGYYNVRNNICHTMSLALSGTYDIPSDISFSNNGYYAGTGVDTFRINGIDGKTWDDWKTSYTETRSLTSDPSFLNGSGSMSTARDFIPAAIGARGGGYAWTGISGITDWQGNGFNLTTPSMGVFQFYKENGVICPPTINGRHYRPQ